MATLDARPSTNGHGRQEAPVRLRPPWPHEYFVAAPPLAIGVGIALLAAVAVAAVLIPAHPLTLERHWRGWMQDTHTAGLEHVALVFNAAGHGLARVLTIVALGLVLLVSRRWLALAAFALTEALTPLVSTLIKQLVDRPRPPGGLVHAGGGAFPSGHAAYAGATCVALVLLFSSPGPRRRIWWPLAALGIAAMAWSRTYLLVHWLADVLAGALLGAGIALLVFGCAQILGTTPRRPRGRRPRYPVRIVP